MENPKINSVAIVGMGLSHIDYISEVCQLGHRKAIADEVWAINKMGAAIHCDVIFRMDDMMTEVPVNQKFWEGINGEKIMVLDLWTETLKKFPGKIITSKAYPEEYPASVEYPLEEVVKCVNSSYFNTTPAYAIAYAIYLGVKQISLYGIDYTYANRHVAESGRACVEFHLREALRRGIGIKIAKNSTLMDTNEPKRKLYGYKVKPTLLDAPKGAGQDSLKGEVPCQVLKDIPKESPT